MFIIFLCLVVVSDVIIKYKEVFLSKEDYEGVIIVFLRF